MADLATCSLLGFAMWLIGGRFTNRPIGVNLSNMDKKSNHKGTKDTKKKK